MPVGRPGLALLLQCPWAARGRAEDRAGKEPAAQVRAASAAPRIRGSATSFLREESVVGRYLERPHSCLDFRGSFKGIFHLGCNDQMGDARKYGDGYWEHKVGLWRFKG